MNYQEALDYLYAPHRVKGERSIKVSQERTLEPMARALADLGNPHTRFRALHVAGSKGKGSTSALLATILRAAGYRVGLYTSPHLHTYRERMQVNGVMPSETEIARRLESLRPLFDSHPELITFELSTILAFTWFADERVDLAVIEVGLGGRLDATNVIQPEVAVITALSLEHTAILGNTIEAIAAEKAGIIKPSVPVVTAPNPPSAACVIAATSARLASPLIRVGADVPYRLGAATPDGQWFDVRRQGASDWQTYWLRLLGAHQVDNAVAAIAAIDAARSRGIDVSDDAIRVGVASVRWPARLEVLSQSPLLVVDGAHTPEAAALAVQAVRRHFAFDRLILVFGAMGDKDVGGILDALLPAASHVVVARSRYPRSLTEEALAQAVRDRGGTVAAATSDVPEALDAALRLAEPKDLILVTGSLFVAAAVQETWAVRSGQPLPAMDPAL